MTTVNLPCPFEVKARDVYNEMFLAALRQQRANYLGVPHEEMVEIIRDALLQASRGEIVR